MILNFVKNQGKMRRRLLYFITIIVILLLQNASFGQAPNLGSASGFAVFTVTGAFTNVGTSTYITGDIGTNAGIFTGFPPGTVDGDIHVANATSAQVAIDVVNAYNSISALTCGTVLTTTLGSGQILTPGIYCHGAATSLTGTLTLNGQGDPDALFIIKIGGAFATSTYSNVVLTNSASACNVYWQIYGQFDLADYSVFKGTLLVDGAINLMTGLDLEGRALSKAGAISLTNTTVDFLPEAAGAITGTLEVCQGQTGVVYTVPLIPNATSYQWTLPGGASLAAGEGTNSITVNFSASATSGDITVYGTNACGDGTPTVESLVVWTVSSTSLIYHH
jgi:hypothetical protein